MESPVFGATLLQLVSLVLPMVMGTCPCLRCARSACCHRGRCPGGKPRAAPDLGRQALGGRAKAMLTGSGAEAGDQPILPLGVSPVSGY